MRIFAAAMWAFAAACAHPPEIAPTAAPSLDAAAEAYVRFALEANTHEDGFVDSYSGPPEWRAQAEAHPRSIDALQAEADRILAEIAAFKMVSRHAELLRRANFLEAHVRASRFRLEMMQGVRLPFADEAERLFGVRPEIAPLASFDAALGRLDALLPPGASLTERAEAFRARYVIPADRLDAVMRAAIAECRRRTLEHIALPSDERFSLEFVTDQPWSGYNWYQGRHHSLIQINTDQPITIDRAIDLGCHEGYPGHHTYQTLLDQRLATQRGWVEFTVFPLHAPSGFIAEGTGNAGIALAFPGDEQQRFATNVLFPLAGLDPATAPAYYAYAAARERLSGVGITIAQMYLDGEISRDQAIELGQRYELRSRSSAEGRLRFLDTYRSYVLNYGLGQTRVTAYLDRVAGADQAARWAAFERLLSEPTLPSDLEAAP